jgi:hypothetical protein
MALTAAPYGLRPVNRQGATPSAGGNTRMMHMTVNVATSMAAGAVVVLGTNGEVTVPATTPAIATTTPILGVISGFRFVDPILRYELYDTFLPANAITAGYTQVRVYVHDDPDQLFLVQAGASVTRAQIGLNFGLSNTQANSAVTKRSTTALNAASATATTTAVTVRLVDFLESGTSTAGDSFTDCIVRWVPGAHAYEKGAGPS